MKFTVRRYEEDPADPATGPLNGEGPGQSSPDDNENPLDREEVPIEEPPLLDKPQLETSSSSDHTLASVFTSQAGALDQGEPMARRGRLYAQRQTRRLVFKDGECNISLGHIKERRRRYLGDIFTTFLDMRWRYVLLMFMLAFVITWILFALIWWVIIVSHEDHLHRDDESWEPCVDNVYNFVTALLFSIETQHTIGYGSRGMEPKCPEAIFLLMMQSCVGVFFQSLMTGIIFAKMSRPKRRGNTVQFSRNAVICQRDGKYNLLFRVADMRKSHIVDCNIRVSLVRNRITKEGELIPLSQVPLKTEAENAIDNCIFLLWPTTITHVIDDESPLYEMSAEGMLSDHFEIIVYLEGTVESTGMTTQVRTSFLPSEIHWGHYLGPLVTYQKDGGQYKVDYAQFHRTQPIENMPECSAKEFDEGQAETDAQSRDTTVQGFTHHMSFIHRLPGLRPGQTPSFPGRHSSLHSYTVGPHRAGSWGNNSVDHTRGRKGREHNPGRRRSARMRFMSRLNGVVRSNSLDALQMRARNKRTPVNIMEPPTPQEEKEINLESPTMEAWKWQRCGYPGIESSSDNPFSRKISPNAKAMRSR